MNGKVWLVGAGPGDPGLLTLRGKEVLEQAQVVVYDALVSPQIRSMIPEDAKKIFAGKRSGHHYLKQEETNRVLLEEAQKGLRVVRLKGGDPFVFGRGGEELELLAEHHVPFEIVPGITSAFAVPAYNGIPVTHRDYCSSVHVITGHKRQDHEYDIDFGALARTGGTLIFLMGIAALPDICDGLLRAGMDPDTPAAVLSRGTTARQARIISTLGTLTEEIRKDPAVTPAIIVVGDVCTLADQFHWYEDKPLAGVRVLVTRPRESSSRLAAMLRKDGADVLEVPAIRVVPRTDSCLWTGLAQGIREHRYDWLVFTSPSGVRIFMDQMTGELDVRELAGIRIAVIGQGSEKELQRYAIKADFVPSVYDGQTLGRELAGICRQGDRMLIPRAAIGNHELIRELEQGPDLMIEDCPIYDTCYETMDTVDVPQLIKEGEIDYVMFTSASTVRGFAEAVPDVDYRQVQAICIGQQTRAAAKALGMQTAMAEKATLNALVQCLKDTIG